MSKTTDKSDENVDPTRVWSEAKAHTFPPVGGDCHMTCEQMIQNARDAKFQIEFMAMMLLAGRKEMAAEAYEKALAKLAEIIGDDD